MTTQFKVNQSIGNYQVDIDDILIRREYFSDGGLWTWGYNSTGELGDNTTVSKSSPVTTIAGGTNWKQVSCGINFFSAIKTDGTLWSWGNNQSGNLGDNSAINKSSPVQVSGGGTNWKQVSCGAILAASAIKTDGTLWTWGVGTYGVLGNNSTVNTSSPITTTGGGTNWKQVSVGGYCISAIKTDGTLWTWGDNRQGQLGDGTTVNKSSPVTVAGGGTNWKQIACAYQNTAAIKTDGTLWTWGQNTNGGLGDGTTVNKSSPVTVAGGGTNWKQVSCGGKYNGFTAIKTDGTLWVCGYNGKGGLGDGTTVNKSSPVTVAGGGTNWKQTEFVGTQTSSIKTDGTLWVCGYNKYGSLGDGTTVNKSSPVTVAGGGTNWKQASVGKNAYGIVAMSAITDLTIGTY